MEPGGVVAGRYRLDVRIGAGGMGVVWRATDTVLDRVVAVKRVLLTDLPRPEAEEARSRVMREARVAARLHHPNAVRIFDVVEDGGEPWLVLEYVPSRSLAEVLAEREALTPEETGRIGAAVADALRAAHAVGIVHRDVKPANVLLGPNGVVKLTDFGISRLSGDLTLTSSGALIGTPAYLAPEVARGGAATEASDVFCLGATLYAAVEGTPPYGNAAGGNLLSVLRLASEGVVPPPRRAGVLTGPLMQLLGTDPRGRPTAAVARDLLAAVASRPGRSRPRRAVVVAGRCSSGSRSRCPPRPVRRVTRPGAP